MYIQYTMDQLYLPMDIEEHIPANHHVRVNAAVNRLDDPIFDNGLPCRWLRLLPPQDATKIVTYAYTLKKAAIDAKNQELSENGPLDLLHAIKFSC